MKAREPGPGKSVSVYTTGNKQDALIKKELLESEGIACRMEVTTDDKTASAWGMPMGMEHLVHTFRLLVRIDDTGRATELFTAAFSEEVLFIVLLDREHNVLTSPAGFPREAIDAAADPKHFSFIGEYAARESGTDTDSGAPGGVLQFFVSKRRKEQIPVTDDSRGWKPLHSVLTEDQSGPSFRDAYVDVILGGFNPPAPVFSAWGFGASPADADSLGKLVVEGNKRATAGLAVSYEAEGEAPPRPGDVSVVVNGKGRPIAVIRTTDVTVLPFNTVTPEMAAEEGEGDLSLAYWRKGHRKFFTRECREIGRSFSEEMDIVFERFELLKAF